jgi:hypothetical protein
MVQYYSTYVPLNFFFGKISVHYSEKINSASSYWCYPIWRNIACWTLSNISFLEWCSLILPIFPSVLFFFSKISVHFSQFIVDCKEQLCSISLLPMAHLAMFQLHPLQIHYPLIEVNIFSSQYLNICSLIHLFIFPSIWKFLYRNNLWTIRPRNTLIYLWTLWCIFLAWRASMSQYTFFGS